ncbi:hypothetical protein C0J52_19369 [Blattella germanica]|nr:hypothetical protein C0J52_19369 [Blattella germanica]
MVLLPEEATLLLERKVAVLVTYPCLSKSPTDDQKKEFKQQRKAIYLDQIECFKEQRRLQVTSMIDHILEGKRKKLMGITSNKKKKTSKNTGSSSKNTCPWLKEEDTKPVEWFYPVTRAEKLRYLTFKDLWEKGHYLTPGQTFGADFLAYPGDPIKFHSQFMVTCIDGNTPLTTTELIALGRMGTSVRKTVVLASLSHDGTSVQYQSLQWNNNF